jgi:transcription initiation factor TFIID subunit 2
MSRYRLFKLRLLILFCRASDVDHEVRWCILKLADIVVRGVEETVPKFTIHLPPTPVVESAPQLPLVKAPPKPQRALKTGGPTAKIPFAPSKLKLSGTTPPVAPAAPDAKKVVTFKEPKAKLKRKPLKSDKGTKAQTSGMTLSDLRACQSALKKLKLSKHAALFMQPVDPIRDHAPKFVITFASMQWNMSLICFTATLTLSRVQWILVR